MDAFKTFTKQPTRVSRIACGAGVMEMEVSIFRTYIVLSWGLSFYFQVHALLDQFKKFSGVVKQMGGVKELFKDEKQVKNLNPQKMGKVCNFVIQAPWRCILSKIASHSQNSYQVRVISH